MLSCRRRCLPQATRHLSKPSLDVWSLTLKHVPAKPMAKIVRRDYRHLWELPPPWPQPLRALNALVVIGALIALCLVLALG